MRIFFRKKLRSESEANVKLFSAKRIRFAFAVFRNSAKNAKILKKILLKKIARNFSRTSILRIYSFPEKSYSSNHIYEKTRYQAGVGRVLTSPTQPVQRVKIDRLLVGRSVVRFLVGQLSVFPTQFTKICFTESKGKKIRFTLFFSLYLIFRSCYLAELQII